VDVSGGGREERHRHASIHRRCTTYSSPSLFSFSSFLFPLSFPLHSLVSLATLLLVPPHSLFLFSFNLLKLKVKVSVNVDGDEALSGVTSLVLCICGDALTLCHHFIVILLLVLPFSLFLTLSSLFSLSLYLSLFHILSSSLSLIHSIFLALSPFLSFFFCLHFCRDDSVSFFSSLLSTARALPLHSSLLFFSSSALFLSVSSSPLIPSLPLCRSSSLSLR